jgi:hypothetical protein
MPNHCWVAALDLDFVLVDAALGCVFKFKFGEARSLEKMI